MANLDRLKARPAKVDLTIPGETDPITYITIVGAYTYAFQDAMQDVVDNIDTYKTIDQVAEVRAEAFSKIIVSWDEETFGPYSNETFIDLVKQEEYSWILDQLEVAVKDTARFFKTESKQPKRTGKSKG